MLRLIASPPLGYLGKPKGQIPMAALPAMARGRNDPRNKEAAWLQSPSAVILEPPKIKSVTISIVSPSICHEVMGPDAMIFVFFFFFFFDC